MNRCTFRKGSCGDLVAKFSLGEDFYAAVEALKTIPGARFDGQAKAWSIPCAHRRRVLAWAGRWFDAGEISDLSQEDEPRWESRREAPQQRPAPPLDAAYRALFLQPCAPPWAVTAVYRAAAKELHPDAGGSHDRMVAVNRAVETLRKAGMVRP